MAESIFRKESLDKVSSPEQLNNYIRVSSPSIWLVLGAAVVLLVSMLVWAVFGTLPTTVTLNGVQNGGELVCYAPDISSVDVGDSIIINGVESGKVTAISKKPVSLENVSSQYSDEYTLYSLNLSEWNYVINTDIPAENEDVIQLQIVVDNVSPISFIWN